VKHFSDEEWLDFVREVMPASRRTVLEEHLLSGCSTCVELRTFWESVRDVAHRHSRAEVPPGLIEDEKAIFTGWVRRFILPTRAKRTYPIFDSLLVPVPTGVRAIALSPRRVVQAWRHWIVDLRILSEPGDRMSLIGQLLRRGWRPENDFKADVLLMKGDTVIAETQMNNFGEFQFGLQRIEDLGIFIDMPRGQTIAVAVPNPDQPLTVQTQKNVDHEK